MLGLSDTHPAAARKQIELLRAAGPARRSQMAFDLSQMAIDQSRRGLRLANPNFTERELNVLFVALNYGSDLAERVTDHLKGDLLNPLDITSALKSVIEALADLGVAFFVGGSVASSLHGLPRSTLDADVVADLQRQDILPLCDALRGTFSIGQSMVEDAVRRRSSFNVIHLETSSKIDVFVLKDREYDRTSLDRRVEAEIGAESRRLKTQVATAEDIILNKLEWFESGGRVSERQWRDVLGVIQVQGARLDFRYLDDWAAELGLAELLNQARGEAGSTGPVP